MDGWRHGQARTAASLRRWMGTQCCAPHCPHSAAVHPPASPRDAAVPHAPCTPQPYRSPWLYPAPPGTPTLPTRSPRPRQLPPHAHPSHHPQGALSRACCDTPTPPAVPPSHPDRGHVADAAPHQGPAQHPPAEGPSPSAAPGMGTTTRIQHLQLPNAAPPHSHGPAVLLLCSAHRKLQLLPAPVAPAHRAAGLRPSRPSVSAERWQPRRKHLLFQRPHDSPVINWGLAVLGCVCIPWLCSEPQLAADRRWVPEKEPRAAVHRAQQSRARTGTRRWAQERCSTASGASSSARSPALLLGLQVVVGRHCLGSHSWQHRWVLLVRPSLLQTALGLRRVSWMLP